MKLDREVERVLRDGRRVSNSVLTLAWSPRDPIPAGSARIALRIPKKYGDAVRRNRARRWLREVFRMERPSLRPDVDLVIFIKPPAAGLVPGFAGMRQAFMSLCRQAGLCVHPEPPLQ